MAADRPTHPSSYAWADWRLQLERDLATRLNHPNEEGKGLENAFGEVSFCVFKTVKKSAPHYKRTAQNNLHTSFDAKILAMRLCIREKKLDSGIKFILCLWTLT